MGLFFSLMMRVVISHVNVAQTHLSKELQAGKLEKNVLIEDDCE